MIHDEFSKIFSEKTAEELFDMAARIGIFIEKRKYEDGDKYEVYFGQCLDGDWDYNYTHEDLTKAIKGLIVTKFMTVRLWRWEIDSKMHFVWRHQINMLKELFNFTEDEAQQYREEHLDEINKIAEEYRFW